MALVTYKIAGDLNRENLLNGFNNGGPATRMVRLACLLLEPDPITFPQLTRLTNLNDRNLRDTLKFLQHNGELTRTFVMHKKPERPKIVIPEEPIPVKLLPKSDQLYIIKENLPVFQNDFTDHDVYLEFDRFNDYLNAKGKRYKDYAAAFRNWLRGAKKYAGPHNRLSPKKWEVDFDDKFNE
jgi:hypothetical protein